MQRFLTICDCTAGRPQVGEFGRISVDAWDLALRSDDEEYFVYVESVVQGGEAADHLYMVQDLEENTGPEEFALDRHSFLQCMCVTICSDVDLSSITQCLTMCIACTHSIH